MHIEGSWSRNRLCHGQLTGLCLDYLLVVGSLAYICKGVFDIHNHLYATRETRTHPTGNKVSLKSPYVSPDELYSLQSLSAQLAYIFERAARIKM